PGRPGRGILAEQRALLVQGRERPPLPEARVGTLQPFEGRDVPGRHVENLLQRGASARRIAQRVDAELRDAEQRAHDLVGIGEHRRPLPQQRDPLRGAPGALQQPPRRL
ncbi:MAG: hypothetical protein ACK559_40485, partial [bacterium]